MTETSGPTTRPIMPERFNSTSAAKITVRPATIFLQPLSNALAEQLMPDVQLQCPVCRYPYEDFQERDGHSLCRCINGHMWIGD